MEMQHLGAQVGAALLLADFNLEYFPQWDIEKRTPHPLTASITNASRDTAHLPGFNDVYDQFDVAFNEEDVKIPLEDKPSSDNLVQKLRDIVPVLETDDRKMSRRSHSKMPKKEVENTDEGTMMDGEMSDHESLQPKLKYTTGRHAKKYEILKGMTKFHFVLHMIKNGEKRTRRSTTIHAHHMVPHFVVMFFDSKHTSSQCAWRCKTTHLFGFGAGFVACIARNLRAPPAAMFLRFEVVEQVLAKSEQEQQQQKDITLLDSYTTIFNVHNISSVTFRRFDTCAYRIHSRTTLSLLHAMGNRDSDNTAPSSATPHADATSSANAPPITWSTPVNTSIERPRGAYDHLGYLRMESV